MDQSGSGIIQVLVLVTLLGLSASYFASRSVGFQSELSRLRTKDQIVTDRKIIEFDLVNRKFPDWIP